MRLSAYHTYPRNQVEIEVRDFAGVGIASISVAKAVNAKVEIPDFAPGADYVQVVATRIDQSKPAQLLLKACSLECGQECCFIGDPVVTQLQIPQGKNRIAESFSEIPAREHFVTFQNGKKGLNRAQVLVNGRLVYNIILRSEEVRMLDIASAMAAPQNNVTVIGRGNSGGSALLVISDVPGAPGDDKAGDSLPYIAWEEGGGEPGANLRWGM